MVIIGISGIMMGFASKPDFIYDHRIRAAGVKEIGRDLKVYTKKISAFSKDYWFSWYGADDGNNYSFVKTLMDKSFELPVDNGANKKIVA